ncbi:MAG: PDZ domain-containing protein [Cytophagales bacterium]|nr:MAG: PDZ domain-containing protein [Cytophagales bacterium]TAF62376.1 MAG: PDZ domain-containing protein [Cytophagales bacterium]
MQNTLKTAFIGFFSGILGAILFYLATNQTQWSSAVLSSENSKVAEDKLFQQANYNGVKTLPDLIEASAISTPTVVFIKTVSQAGRQYVTWMDMFFGNSEQNHEVLGTGSGVIISADGYVVTNNHVIKNAKSITVVHNKRNYEATVIGIDASTDLALLKIEGSRLPFIRFASSQNLRIGEWVLAVGNPFNLNSTVTAGIVSAKGRKLDSRDAGQFPVESFIQTDAAINPGNSGGALVNDKGELVGINTAIYSKNGSYVGYGFAVPSDVVAKVVADLKNYGIVQKAFIGADVVEVTEEIANRLDLKNIRGVAIFQLDAEGAAEQAGLKKGDVILEINSVGINSKSDYDEQMSYYRPGQEVRFKVERGSEIKELKLTLTNINGGAEIIKTDLLRSQSLNASFETAPKYMRSKIGIQNGVLLKDNQDGKLAGIEDEFIIVSINDRPMKSPKEVVEVLESSRGRVIIRGYTQSGQEGVYAFTNR